MKSKIKLANKHANILFYFVFFCTFWIQKPFLLLAHTMPIANWISNDKSIFVVAYLSIFIDCTRHIRNNYSKIERNMIQQKLSVGIVMFYYDMWFLMIWYNYSALKFRCVLIWSLFFPFVCRILSQSFEVFFYFIIITHCF